MIVAGPTTLMALLNSLQMGFRTLAIQQRSSEVWNVLGSVKTEFDKFGGVLEKLKKKLQEASNVVDQASQRSRALNRKLRDVQALPAADATEADALALPGGEDLGDVAADLTGVPEEPANAGVLPPPAAELSATAGSEPEGWRLPLE